ncbi:hypothetical protein ZIOFF_000867 [Zingiber officinale]|uniref:Uncharacterized protein n=1 Tax=Zingiber officinale TaxID=94328 RepID=A0A8J5IKN6_ZINOF|nr:hypothetical protein ZIOFF_000867 [Zingiber officinale]
MDYVFLLDSDDRRRFLQLAGRVLGCSYICTWCPAANQLISMEGWHHEEDNNVPGSSSGIMSLRLFDAYRRSICSILRGCIPGLTFSSGFNYLEIKDADVMSLAALNEQRQFYQKAGIKTIMFLGSGKGEVELGMATPPNAGYRSKSGFMVYDRNLAQELEKSVSNKLGGGQKMIKAGIEILRRKDKASVLANTKNYLTSLKAQIKELEERNQMLEPMRQLIEEGIGESKEKVEVRIIRTAESAPEGSQFINFKLVIIVREQCEMMNLVVHLLECLKERGITNLVAMETSTASQAGAIFARINVGLQVKASDWDEESFTEAAKGAVNDVLHVDDNKGDDDRSLNIL